jgi:dihydrofolate reductase
MGEAIPAVGEGWQAIAAMAENRVIGLGNRLPWHLPEDFRWFKERTLGGTLVMGRRTLESIGRLLPGRETVVLSRSGWEFPGARTVSSLEVLEGEGEGEGVMKLKWPVFICGGAEVYGAALPRCTDLWLTRVFGEPEGDAWFPVFEDRFERVAVIRERPEFRVEHWRRLGIS